MQITKIPLQAIIESRRLREDYGDLEELKESLKTFGLLQPVGLREKGEGLETIWGGRRIQAARELGWTEIEAKILTCEEDYQLREMELEENVRRKDMSWQEQTNALYEIHSLKKSRNALIGEAWGVRDTGRLLGISTGNVSYSLAVAKALRTGDKEVKDSKNLTEAIMILAKKKEAEAMRRGLATQSKASQNTSEDEEYFSSADKEKMKAAAEAASDHSRVFRIYKGDPLQADIILTEPSGMPYIGTKYGIHFWDPRIQESYEEVAKLFDRPWVETCVFQDQSIASGVESFKPQLLMATLFGPKQPLGAKGESAVVLGNAFVERKGGDYPYATDPNFIQRTLNPFSQSKGFKVGLMKPTCPSYGFAALLKGHPLVVSEDHLILLLTEKLSSYGKVETTIL